MAKKKAHTAMVSSLTDKTKAYMVTIYSDNSTWCGCPAQRFKPYLRPCKHIRAVVKARAMAGIGQGAKIVVEAREQVNLAITEKFAVQWGHDTAPIIKV